MSRVCIDAEGKGIDLPLKLISRDVTNRVATMKPKCLWAAYRSWSIPSSSWGYCTTGYCHKRSVTSILRLVITVIICNSSSNSRSSPELRQLLLLRPLLMLQLLPLLLRPPSLVLKVPLGRRRLRRRLRRRRRRPLSVKLPLPLWPLSEAKRRITNGRLCVVSFHCLPMKGSSLDWKPSCCHT